MPTDFGNLNSMHIDVFQEIGNIGAGNAATALATLLNRKISMKVPSVKIIPFTEMPEIMGGADRIVVGSLVEFYEDMSGYILLVIGLKEAYEMSSILFDREPDPNKIPTLEDLGDMDLSALTEISNILVGSYLSAISSLTDLKIRPSVPAVCVDMVGAILSVIAADYGYRGDHVLYLETQFSDSPGLTEGNFFLMPDYDSFDKLLSSLGVGS